MVVLNEGMKDYELLLMRNGLSGIFLKFFIKHDLGVGIG
jgi:hypothetical protein